MFDWQVYNYDCVASTVLFFRFPPFPVLISLDCKSRGIFGKTFGKNPCLNFISNDGIYGSLTTLPAEMLNILIVDEIVIRFLKKISENLVTILRGAKSLIPEEIQKEIFEAFRSKLCYILS